MGPSYKLAGRSENNRVLVNYCNVLTGRSARVVDEYHDIFIYLTYNCIPFSV